ncbi:MAG: hypothetical protein AAGH15_08220 [Myxococcota bacterium]
MLLGGPIPEDGIVNALRAIEAQRTTGSLRYRGTAGEEGEVRLVRGQIAAEQHETADGSDPVEVLLALRAGHYELEQRLPPLPVSKGDHLMRSGSLVVHVTADLMNYCERAGLTGLLVLEQGDKGAEIAYARGDLESIRLDGLSELHQVFAWEEGKFRVEAHAELPRFDVSDDAAAETADPFEEAETTEFVRPSQPTTATRKQLLRVVEMELAEILREREERRPATKTSPPLPPLAEVRAPETLPPPAGEVADPPPSRREPTVRVVYLGAAPRPEPSGSHEAPEPEASHTPEEAVPAESPASPGALGAALWAVLALLVALGALTVLAALPTLD